MIRAICGAYRTTSSSKLLEITQTIEIEKELEIRAQTASLPRDLKKETRRNMPRDRLNEREKLLNLGPNFNTLDITKRTTVWAVTEAGPFRHHLHLLNLTEDSLCRFCHLHEETAHHLLTCEYFNFDLNEDSPTEKL